MKYIDVEKLIDEIKRLRKVNAKALKSEPISPGFLCGRAQAFNYLLKFIHYLQQEQPEVDLDFSMFAKEMDVVFNLPKEVTKNTEQNPLNWEYAIARHFYELGLNARNEDKK